MYPGRRKTKLPRTSAMNLKTVEVPRGRNGYGFTVSGQSPCVLSCILHGSPAEIAGIKTGDSVIAVNGENVTRLSHEQIIKLIGATTGVLRLTVAEMDYSESSDDEYVYMPRTRYPHAKRSQSATPLSMIGSKARAEMVVEEMQQGALLDSFSMHTDIPQAMLRGAEVQRIQADVQISSSKFAPGHLSPLNQPGNGEMLLKRSPNYDYSYWNGKSVEKMNVPQKARKPRRHNDPRNRMFSTPTPTSYYIRENPYDDNDPEMRPLSPVELSHLMYPGNDASRDASRGMHKSVSLPGHTSRNVSQGHSMSASFLEDNENVHMRAMVGYLGSIDIPASANLPTASLHAIRGCVRRLHKEHRVHSFMMMEIRTDGVRLVNSNQRIAVVYPRERLAFSGVCPDDKRFFGIVTSQNPEEMLDAMDSDDEPIGSSCHVFMVDPEFRRHDVHARVVSQFGISCCTNPETNTCDIFPSSAKPILQQVSQLYRDRNDLSYFGELYGHSSFASGPRRSNSTNSSNSDSGFGNGNSKDQSDFNVQMDHSHHNPILDVASLMRNKRGGGTRHVVPADVNASLSSDVPYSLSSTSPQSIDTSPQNIFRRNTKDVSGRLTPRARPDPVGFRSPSVVPAQQDNAFHYQQQAARPSSVQVPLQSHIQHSAPPELKQFKQPGVDFNAPKPNAESSGSSTLEDNSQRGKELMGPPKGLPPTGRHSLYSKPSQNFINEAIDQDTARKVQNELSRRLSENQSFHQKQQLLRRNSDCSEYSSSTRLSKQAIERLQKIRQDPHHLTPSTQQTLATSETNLNNDSRGIHSSASNPNLVAQGSGLAELDPSIGRVSSWAVDFERLLTDELGLACFTEFLKKEFSDENIMFWIACERMSKIKDHKELQRTAQEIYNKHLASKALMPVNLDSGARSMVEDAMKNPTPEMYKVQQLQIFKLMKFDSYSRFLKSKLYQDCVLAEMGGLPLPISLETVPTGDSEPSAGDLEDSGGVHGGSGGMSSESSSYEKGGEKNGGVMLGGTVKDRMERKKSGNKRESNRTVKKRHMFIKKNGIPSEKEEENQDKKRSSILPWRNKQKKGKEDKTSSGNEDTSVSSRHSSITSSDFRPAGDKFVDMNRCFHMIFPNNEILTLTPDPQQSVRGILIPLLEERGLGLQNVEIFLNDTKETESVKQKLINLEQLATEMIGRQIVVERRVVFKIELPNKRVIGVKSKLTKKIIEVLRPVTYKYKLQLDALVVHLSDSPVPLDLDITVASLDGQRILIETLEQYSAGSYSIGGRASVGPAGDSKQKSAETRASSVDSYLKDDEAVRPDSSKVAKDKLTSQVSAPAISAFQAPRGDTMREQRDLAAAAAKAAPQVKNLPPSSSSVSTSALGTGRTEGRAEARRAAGNLKVTGKDTEEVFV
ncbi:regulator of G-protein signaling 12-like isoform X4 [Lytechinus variegatus]|uniref:regulator of G-protein signaling 12-like isoform X4 n=1 Tax=Lytechinus variegatus TaxID=7654 RepID=UPI001BB193F5|nr:regulator of G-protein signaling 12-like isoform X4 [Lytechinus variegatus]